MPATNLSTLNKTSPLVVTGMHRSGTSLTAALFQAVGVDVGSNLFEADARNVKGYFEDVDFLEFQRSLLQSCCNDGEPGWADWGWTESEQLDRQKFDDFIEPARKLLESRQNINQGSNSIWGWKDPRTSLMLDFWHNLIPDARYILVYRLPWDVADSILRLNAPIFFEHPDYALRIWCFYNKHLLEFYTANRDRCILANVNAFLEHPDLLVELLQSKFELPVRGSDSRQAIERVYDPQIFRSLDWQHPTVQLLQHTFPDCTDLLSQLDRVADISSNFPAISTPRSTTNLTLSLHHKWLKAESAVNESGRQLTCLETDRSNLTHEILALQSQIDECRQQYVSLEADRNTLANEVAAMKTSKFWKLREAWFALKSSIEFG